MLVTHSIGKKQQFFSCNLGYVAEPLCPASYETFLEYAKMALATKCVRAGWCVEIEEQGSSPIQIVPN
jgi:hypothetical protein